MAHGLNNWSFRVEMPAPQAHKVAALLNMQLDSAAPALLGATVRVSTGVWTWFGWRFGVDVRLPANFKSGRENVRGSAGGADAAGRMRLGPFLGLKRLKAKKERQQEDDERDSVGESTLAVTHVNFTDGAARPQTAGAGLAASVVMAFDSRAVTSKRTGRTKTPAFALRLEPPLRLRLRTVAGTAATLSFGASPPLPPAAATAAPAAPAGGRRVLLRAGLEVGAAEAAALGSLLAFLARSRPLPPALQPAGGDSAAAALASSMVLGFEVVGAGPTGGGGGGGGGGGRCSAIQRMTLGVGALFNYSHDMTLPCRPWDFNHSAAATARENAAADGDSGASGEEKEKGGGSEFSLSKLPYEVTWRTQTPAAKAAGRNEMTLTLRFGAAVFGRAAFSAASFPGLQAHVITGGQHCLSMGVTGAVVRAGQPFVVHFFVRVADASESAREGSAFRERFGSSLDLAGAGAGAAGLCPAGTAGSGGGSGGGGGSSGCSACPAGMHAPVAGLLRCIRLPASGAAAALPPSAFVVGDRLFSRLLSGQATNVTLRFGGAAASLEQHQGEGGAAASAAGAGGASNFSNGGPSLAVFGPGSVLGTVLQHFEVRQSLWDTAAPNATAARAAAARKHQRVVHAVRSGFGLGTWRLKAVGPAQLWAVRQFSLSIPFIVMSLLPSFDVGSKVTSMRGGVEQRDALVVTLGESEDPLARLGVTVYVDKRNFLTK
jgi:hypothetical protein